MSIKSVIIVALAATSLAFPSNVDSIQKRDVNTNPDITGAILKTISSTVGNCGSDKPECVGADDAAKYLNTGFKTYNVIKYNTKAALIALTMFESVNYTYSNHIYPSPVPGQGTRNMQSPQFNLAYAYNIFPMQAVTAAYWGDKDSGYRGVLNLILSSKEADFASAAWFLRTQTPPTIFDANKDAAANLLASGTLDGWHTYLLKYVQIGGDTVPAERDVVWRAARKALIKAANPAIQDTALTNDIIDSGKEVMN